MVSSGMLRRVALVRATRRNFPEDTILHSAKSFSILKQVVLAATIEPRNMVIARITRFADKKIWNFPKLVFALILTIKSLYFLNYN
jgi:hypothetical protein